MRHLSRTVSTVILIICVPCLSGGTSAQNIGKAGDSVVRGKVTIQGKAAVGVFVGVRPTEAGTSLKRFTATTDANGEYVLAGLPTGNYQILPIAPAYASRPQTVVVVAGQSIDAVDFALVRGGVITGRVTDADGQPLIEQRVNLLPADVPRNSKEAVSPIRTFLTDDRGIYRMFGLFAGRYKVATGQSNETLTPNPTAGRPSYKQIYHPDVSDAAKATVIEVTEGSETANVDITVGRATDTFSVAGRVIDNQSEQPVANVSFSLQLIAGTERRAPVNNTAVSNSNGEFVIEDLAPGKYVLTLQKTADSDLRAEPVTFQVIDQNLDGLVIRAVTGASLTGTVVLSAVNDSDVLAMLPQLRINANIETRANTSASHSTEVNSDGSFFLHALEPGLLKLSLGSRDPGLLKRFRILRVTRAGIAQPKGTEVNPGERITGVRVILSYGNASVYGTVNLVNGTLPKGARIQVRATISGRPGSLIRSPMVDARGHFLAEGLVSGTYEFTVTIVIPKSNPANRPSGKQVVTLADDAVTEVTITVDLKQALQKPINAN